MDRNIKVTIEDRVATTEGDPSFICGNSTYTVTFSFDDEWEGFEVKTALFKWLTADGMKKHEQPFTGDTVEAPVFFDTREVEVGVYAGDLTTTTGAPVRCKPSVRCGAGEDVEPDPDKYDALMELIKDGSGATDEQIAAAVENYLTKNPVDCLTEEQAADLAANTEARHTHANKENVLDFFGINYAKTRPTFKGDATGVMNVLAFQDDITTRTGTLKQQLQDQIAKMPKFEDIPTKTSQLANDSDFVTAEYVTNAINGSLDEVEAMIDESGVLDE